MARIQPIRTNLEDARQTSLPVLIPSSCSDKMDQPDALARRPAASVADLTLRMPQLLYPLRQASRPSFGKRRAARVEQMFTTP